MNASTCSGSTSKWPATMSMVPLPVTVPKAPTLRHGDGAPHGAARRPDAGRSSRRVWCARPGPWGRTRTVPLPTGPSTGRDRTTSSRKAPTVLDHLSIQCADVATSAAFYDAVLAPIGGTRIADYGDVIGYGVPPRPVFWIAPRQTGDGFRESHIAFVAPDRAAVRRFFEAAVTAGAAVLHDPQVWPEYHGNYYGAFVRDP